ncbi:alpha/beta hydrolase fold domain-containing protein [Plantactinospora solaniradicis]|uniref:Alpha/beta hydrolase fold domain-containing protein n=1 Tax=Plantactinospora solaniradicis TaxID=1723736 RepID=A0ABW1KHM8_9ACTN
MSSGKRVSTGSPLPGLTISTDAFEGWPVHEVSPRPGDGAGHVLYLHGGGYVSELQPPHWEFVARLATLTGRTFTVPEYPVAPGHTHRDVFPTLRRLYDRLAGRHARDRFAVVGDSAGGTMGLALVQSLPPASPRPADIILMSPWLDATMTNPDISAIEPYDPMSSTGNLIRLAGMWAGPDDPSTPWLSPINGPLEDLGRVTIFAATNDILTPDARRLEHLADGVAGTDLVLREFPDMTHAWMLLRPGPETDAVVAEIVGQLGHAAS